MFCYFVIHRFYSISKILFKRETSYFIWFTIFVALMGFALLSIDFSTFTILWGDFLVFLGSIFWAVHVSFIEHYSTYEKLIELAAIQFLVCSLLSLFISMFVEEISIPMLFRAWIPLLYAGIFSVGIAFILQIYAQRFVPANIAGIILSSEALFALLGGIVILDEFLSAKQWIGVACIVVAIGFVQFYPFYKRKKMYANT